MKKTLLSVITVALVSVATISCTSNETKEKQSEKMDMGMEAGVQYTCPMHPEVVTDKPGSCPKCGMDLVKKEAEKMEVMPDSTMKGDTTMKM